MALQDQIQELENKIAEATIRRTEYVNALEGPTGWKAYKASWCAAGLAGASQCAEGTSKVNSYTANIAKIDGDIPAWKAQIESLYRSPEGQAIIINATAAAERKKTIINWTIGGIVLVVIVLAAFYIYRKFIKT